MNYGKYSCDKNVPYVEINAFDLPQCPIELCTKEQVKFKYYNFQLNSMN